MNDLDYSRTNNMREIVGEDPNSFFVHVHKFKIVFQSKKKV